MEKREHLKYLLKIQQEKTEDITEDKRQRKASKGNIKRLQKAIDNLKD